VRKFGTPFVVGSALLLATVGTGAAAQDGSMSEGIVSDVIKAPIIADGDVVGQPTDLVFVLDTDLDPAVPGRTLLAGNSVRITFPEEFQSVDVNAGPAATCEAPCNTGVILQGWPQRPFPPTPEFYSVEMDGSHTFVMTALQDLAPGGTPGAKQFHLILSGITNPAEPGDYAIAVEAETGPDGALETGTGVVTIHAAARPSINVTSIFAKANDDDPNGNTIYQEAEAGGSPPFAWDFFLFGADGGAVVGAELQQNDDTGGDIVQDGAVIGTFSIAAPDGATGQSVSGGPSVDAVAPVLGKEAGRLTASFTAGDSPGDYVTTFQMDGGNAQQMFVSVPG
jgi:hypothetical protein